MSHKLTLVFCKPVMRHGLGHRVSVRQRRPSVAGELVDFDKQASGPLSFLVQWVITQSNVVFLSRKMALTSDDKFFLYSIIFPENYLFLQEHF